MRTHYVCRVRRNPMNSTPVATVRSLGSFVIAFMSFAPIQLLASSCPFCYLASTLTIYTHAYKPSHIKMDYLFELLMVKIYNLC